MSSIALVTPSSELLDRLQRTVDTPLLVQLTEALPAHPAELFDRLAGQIPEVLILDAAPPRAQEALALAAQFDEQFPNVTVVLVSDEAVAIGLAAIRAGVRDILHPQAGEAEIRWVLDRACKTSQMRPAGFDPLHQSVGDPQQGRVITVASPKGGVGKTAIATNLGVGLARHEPGSTVLVDLDVQFGDVDSALDLTAEYTLEDAVNSPAAQDPMVLKTFLTRHRSGLYVLPAPVMPAAADGITPEQIVSLLAMLAGEFRNVVIDTAAGISDPTLAAFDISTDLVLVTSMDVPAVRAMRKELATLAALGLSDTTRHLVVNLAEPGGGLTVADVEASLSSAVALTLPRSKVGLAATNQGIPLLESGVRDPLTKELRRLLARVAPQPAHRSPSSAPASPPRPRSPRLFIGKGSRR
ncbi:AAA family ATPase [Brevibacterium daeguense]|uniref:AAA family ATPase n=1 Tax=Brevibacterium daeguense TaxID=909936 RepID=A0ABP8EGN8_9MICO|nr:AAA family ATPase [Brevibacterium daeguense]